MITPQDIQSIEFEKAVRGYKEDQVDVFLDQLTTDYEAVLNENSALKQKISELSARLDDYHAQESAVLKTLESAKALMNDISVSAEKRANILLKNAELDAELKQRQANENLERLKQEESQLERRVASIRTRFKNILEAELERFDGLTEELFAEIPDTAAKTDISEQSVGLSAWEDHKFDTVVNLRKTE